MNRIARTDLTRLFLAPGGVAVCGNYQYADCVRVDSMAQSAQDSEQVHMVNRSTGRRTLVGRISGAEGDWTGAFVGNMVIDDETLLWQIRQSHCLSDAHLNLGRCTDPLDIDSWESGFILEGLEFTNYSTGAMGALSPDERSTLQETLNWTAQDVYRKKRQAWGEVPTGTFEEGIGVSVVTYGNPNRICASGQCTDACAVLYAITQDDLEPFTAYVYYSIDGGVTWNDSDITNTFDSISALRLEAASNGNLGLINMSINEYYSIKVDGRTGQPISIVRVGGEDLGATTLLDDTRYADVVYTTVLAGPPTHPQIYAMDLKTNTVSIVSELPELDFLGISGFHMFALSERFWVASNISTVASGTVFTENAGRTWRIPAMDGMPAGPLARSVYAFDELNWLIGDQVGRLYRTRDQGQSWILQAILPGVATAGAEIRELHFPTRNLGYAACGDTVYRTYDGGCSWVAMPDATGDPFPAFTGFIRMDVCPLDPNQAVAWGAATTFDGMAFGS